MVDDQRAYVDVTSSGKFRVPIKETATSYAKTIEKDLSPRDLVNNEHIRNSDPTLTLETGEKIRVFLGGDPTYMIAQAESAIDNHEEYFKQKVQPKVRKVVPRYDTDEYDIFDGILGWDDADTD